MTPASGGSVGRSPSRSITDHRPIGAHLRAPSPRTADVEREALLARLRPHRGVALVIGPPGFGKTTLLGQWERADDRPFAWLSLDPADNDPEVLWNDIALAIGSITPEAPQTIQHPRPPREDPEIAVPRLLRELEDLGTDVVLVLEDAHWITDDACLTSLARFLDNQPSNVTVLLSARSDLRIPLGELRIRVALLELRAADLGFTLAEANRYLNDSLALGLGPAAIRSLWNRTEGWPAGLYLAYLSLRDSPDRGTLVAQFRGSSRHVVEYLTEVVVDSLDERTSDFLLGTSILDRMTGPLCDAVLGAEGSTEFLESLEHANLFVVALDDHREWYRYHRLFIELLRDELQRRHPDRIPDLHRRASEWLKAEHPGDAIRHALEAGDLESAITHVGKSYLKALQSGHVSTVEHWLAMFNREEVVADAQLSVVQAWLMSLQGRYGEADLAVENARRAGHIGPLLDGARSVEVSAALVRANTPRGDVAEMLAAARTAFGSEGEVHSMWEVTAHVRLGWALLLSGQLDEAQPLLERAAIQAPMTEEWLDAFGSRCLLAWVALRDERVQEAEKWARDAIDVAESHDLGKKAVDVSHATLGAVWASDGRTDEASELLEGSLDGVRRLAPPLLLADVLLALAPVRRALGRSVEARAALDEARGIVDSCSDPGIIGEQLERAAKSLTPAYRRIAGAGSLTERELEVLRLFDQGMSKREIARTLYVSFNTVHSHTKSIYRKLGAYSRDEAIGNARNNGILGTAPPPAV